jgi:hypothetical protein
VQQFETGKTYSTRSICDHNCIFKVTVLSRTAKTITTDRGLHRITISENAETVKPWGSYSMCPVISATDTAALKPDWEK